MSNKNQQLALEFCKKCLGWKEALYVSGSRHNRARIYAFPYVISSKQPRAFNYNDLRQVMKYVKLWCDKNHYWIDFQYTDNSKEWNVAVNEIKSSNKPRSIHHQSLCIAIMMACVETS